MADLIKTPSAVDTRIEQPLKVVKSIDLITPASDRFSLLYVHQKPLQILEVVALVEGTTPAVTWNIQYSADATTFTSIFNNDNATSNTTKGSSYFPQSKKIPEGMFLWVNVALLGGTVDHFHLSMLYEQF